jgi:hypothetical protein
VHDHHGLDLVILVPGELLLDHGRVHAAAPVGGNELDHQAQFLRHISPENSEMSGLEHQDLVARRQGVDQRRLPGSGARGGVDHDGPRCLEDALDSIENFERECGKLRSTMIYGRSGHST